MKNIHVTIHLNSSCIVESYNAASISISLVVLGAVIAGSVEGVADFHAAGLLGDALNEALVDALFDEHTSSSDAVLAFVEEHRVARL